MEWNYILFFHFIGQSFGWYFYDINNCPKPSQPIVEYYDIENFQFIFFSERVIWNEAKLICSVYRAGLAVINTPILAKKITEKIANSNIEMEDFWIGGHRQDNTTWSWTDQSTIPVDLEKPFPPWVRNPYRAIKECLAMDRRSHNYPSFIDLDCRLPKPFICQKQKRNENNPNIIPPPSQWVTNGKNTFILYNHRATWLDAAGFCRILGYRLAIIRNNDDAKLIAKAMVRSRPSFESMWISGYHFENNWRWLSTGQLIPSFPNENNYPPWYKKHINFTNGCILFDRHEKNMNVFAVTRCSGHKNFLCENSEEIEDFSMGSKLVYFNYHYWKFVLVLTELPWHQAVAYCQGLGGYLTEVEDKRILETITSVMADQISEPTHVWLGGKLEDGTWYWPVQNKSITTNRLPWREYENNVDESCLNLDRKLHDQPEMYGLKCKLKQPFVCTLQRTKSDTTVIPSTSNAVMVTSTNKVTTAYSDTSTIIPARSTLSSAIITLSPTAITCTTPTRTVITSTMSTAPTLTTLSTTVKDAVSTTLVSTTSSMSTVSPTTQMSTIIKTPSTANTVTAIPEKTIPPNLITSSSTVKDAISTTLAFTASSVSTVPSTIQMSTVIKTPSTTNTVTATSTKTATTSTIPILTTSFTTAKETVSSITTTATSTSAMSAAPTTTPTFTTTEAVPSTLQAAVTSIITASTTPTSMIIHTILTSISATNNIPTGTTTAVFSTRLNPTVTSTAVMDITSNKQEICNHSPISVQHDLSLFMIIFELHTFDSALDKCMEMDGELALLENKNTNDVIDAIFSITDVACSEMKFWIKAQLHCTELDVLNEVINLSQECSKQQGIICDITLTTSATTTTALTTGNQEICRHSSITLPRDSSIFIIVFEAHTFEAAIDKCMEMDGKLPFFEDEDMPAVVDAILDINDTVCSEMKFWVDGQLECTELDALNEVINLSQECLQQQGFICDITMTTVDTTTKPIVTTTAAPSEEEVCDHPPIPLPRDFSLFMIVFEMHTFGSAFDKCIRMGGKLPLLIDEDITAIVDATLDIEDRNCSEMQFWIDSQNGCANLDPLNEVVNLFQVCSKQQGFICEIICDGLWLGTVYNKTKYECNEDVVPECPLYCQEETILTGSDVIICSERGWVTIYNQTTQIPFCDNQNYAIKNLIHEVHHLSNTHTGALFIVDESFSVNEQEWLIQLQFVSSMIQILHLSTNFPVGLLMFSREPYLPISYNTTDTCSALKTIKNLKISPYRDFTYYREVLEEADRQIRIIHGNRPTLIFFISDGENNGDDYIEILEKIKRNNHTFIAIGIQEEPLSDLNQVATMKDSLLLMHKFKHFSMLKNFALDLMKYRSQTVNCSKDLYVLFDKMSKIRMRRSNSPTNNAVCENQIKTIKIKGVSYTVNFNKLSYTNAQEYCTQLNGQLANLQKHQEKIFLVLLKSQANNFHASDFWVNNNGIKPVCSALSINNGTVNKSEETNCLKQFGSICEHGCFEHPTDEKYQHNIWVYKERQNIKTCEIKCKDNTIMMGTNSLICNDTNWVTHTNNIVELPVCLSSEKFKNEFNHMVNKLKQSSYGFLFIFDKPNPRYEHSLYKQFNLMETLLNIHLPSTHSPVGLLTFDETVRIEIAYNETDYCKVKQILHGLKRQSKYLKSSLYENHTYFYTDALIVAQKQIEVMQSNRKTLIFFIASHMNSGSNYTTIAAGLKEKHIIFSIGYGYNSLNDLNRLASIASNNLLMYSFKSVKQLKNIIKLIKRDYGAVHHCRHISKT